MKRTVSAVEARRQLGKLLERARKGDEIVIERNGEPMGVLVSTKQYAAMVQKRIDEWLEATWKRNAGVSDEEAMRLALEAVAWARGKRPKTRCAG